MNKYNDLMEEKEYILERLYTCDNPKTIEYYENRLEEIENKLNKF